MTEAPLDLSSIRVEAMGNRVRVVCDGYRMGPFSGELSYTIFPGSRLIQQEAVLSTDVPDTAYYYDAGLVFKAVEHRRPGRNMHTRFAYYDTEGHRQSAYANGLQNERISYKVRYRALATAAWLPFHPRISISFHGISRRTWAKTGTALGAMRSRSAFARSAIPTGGSIPG